MRVTFRLLIQVALYFTKAQKNRVQRLCASYINCFASAYIELWFSYLLALYIYALRRAHTAE